MMKSMEVPPSKNMTIREALTKAIKQLQQKKITSSRLDAEVILSFLLNQPKEFLYTHPKKELTKAQQTKFQKLIKKRSTHYPIAYITNHKEFFGLDFYVDKNVLIPRPETELLVEETLTVVKKQKSKETKKQVKIAEIGTGSGCIAICLSVETQNFAPLRYYATDISAKALSIAKKNAKKHNVLSKIKFFQGNLLEPIKNKKIDILIANLPYGWNSWKNQSSAETKGLQFEPAKALFTKEKGLFLYHQLLEQITDMKRQPTALLLEIDPRQKNLIQNLVKKIFPKAKINFIKDLADRNRIIIVRPTSI